MRFQLRFNVRLSFLIGIIFTSKKVVDKMIYMKSINVNIMYFKNNFLSN